MSISFNGSKTIDRVVVYTLQDNYTAPVEPTDSMTFSLYGITAFTVQGRQGTKWITLATVSGNNLVKRTVTFAPFTTSQIRIRITAALASFSRITEIEAWGTKFAKSITSHKQNAPLMLGRFGLRVPDDDLLSHGQSALSSARRRFTVLFGMGRGGASGLSSSGIDGCRLEQSACGSGQREEEEAKLGLDGHVRVHRNAGASARTVMGSSRTGN